MTYNYDGEIARLVKRIDYAWDTGTEIGDEVAHTLQLQVVALREEKRDLRDVMIRIAGDAPSQAFLINEIADSIADARVELGDDLMGYSVVDMIADQFPDLALDEVRWLVDRAEERLL